MRIRRKNVLHWLLVLLCAWVLPSCMRHETAEVDAPVAMPGAFSKTGSAPLPGEWWTAFGDETLNGLVERAVTDNFSLRSVWDRLAQAKAIARRSGSALWPAVDASAGAARSVRETGPTRGYATDLSLGLSAGYEVDLWGRIRSEVDAADLDALASREDLHAAAITLSAEVAGTWIRLIEQRGQLVLLDEQARTNTDYLKLITLRFSRGQSSATDVLQQKQLVERTLGERKQVESAAATLRHQLAVLLGRAPGSALPEAPTKLPAPPPLPATGLPSAWLRRRPDLAAAEIRVKATDQRVWAAVADQWPRLTLSARAETTATRIRDLFDNWLASLAAGVIAPLFDGQRRSAEIERTRAEVSERLNDYGQSVLTALQEVEDALIQEVKQQELVESQRRQLALSALAVEQTRSNYLKGTGDFTRYLTTLLSHQGLQRTALGAERQLVQFRINLYRALGGGWPLSRPQPRQIQNGKGKDDDS